MLKVDDDWLDDCLHLLRLDHLVLNQEVLLEELLLLLFVKGLDLPLGVYGRLDNLQVKQLRIHLDELLRLRSLLEPLVGFEHILEHQHES